MQKIILAFLLLCLVSCQESLEDRCDREAREFTKKNCPVALNEEMTLDSMSFNKNTLTLNYYYTVNGTLDDAEALEKADARKMLLKELRNTTSIKNYKDAGYKFSYTYWSASKKGKTVASYTFTQKDYN